HLDPQIPRIPIPGGRRMTPQELTRDNIAAVITTIFEKRSKDEYAGEAVTVAEHMLQGAHLATTAGESEEIVAAALLHDIGHFTGSLGMYDPGDKEDRHHDEAGAAFLEPFFPPVVVECVRLHVAAKRYLCATDPAYFGKLSEASVHTLELQGGPMSADEVAAFEQNPWHKEAVKVRLWDEEGKDPDMVVPGIRTYEALLQRVADQAATT
ncbi:MAG: HD domain-containing protein, partial [Methyloligellaceae bacterium]